MKRLLLISVLLALTAGCRQIESQKPASPVQVSTQDKPSLARQDDWQRMKECAEQADREAKRSGWIEGKRDGDASIVGWQNHYSPKYERCYVSVSYINHEARKDRDLPLLTTSCLTRLKDGCSRPVPTRTIKTIYSARFRRPTVPSSTVVRVVHS